MLYRPSVIYLWISLFLAVSVGRLRDLAGAEALIFGYAVFVTLTAAAIWKIAATTIGRFVERDDGDRSVAGGCSGPQHLGPPRLRRVRVVPRVQVAAPLERTP